MSLCLFTLEAASQGQAGSLGKGDQEYQRCGIFSSAKDPHVHSTTSLECGQQCKYPRPFPSFYYQKEKREEKKGGREGERMERMKEQTNEWATIKLM